VGASGGESALYQDIGLLSLSPPEVLNTELIVCLIDEKESNRAHNNAYKKKASTQGRSAAARHHD
jgi:hypothetical protein